MLSDILARHRGPYQFRIVRPHATKPGFYTSEMLSGEVVGTAEEIGQEAMALLADPRDTICCVNVWSMNEEQYVTTISGERDL